MTLIPSSTPPLPDAIGRRMPLLKFLLPLVGGIVLAWTCKDMINRWGMADCSTDFYPHSYSSYSGETKMEWLDLSYCNDVGSYLHSWRMEHATLQ